MNPRDTGVLKHGRLQGPGLASISDVCELQQRVAELGVLVYVLPSVVRAFLATKKMGLKVTV